jgi:hypothetical protein
MTVITEHEAVARLKAAVARADSGIATFTLPSLDLGEHKAKAIQTLDSLTSALDVVLSFGWIIPDQHEAPLKALRDALTRVRAWID